MEIKVKILKYVVAVLAALMLASVLYSVLHERSHQKEITSLKNEIASKDETIEVSKGVYQKLAIESKNLMKLLDTKDAQIAELQKIVKKSGDEVLAVTSVSLSWKKAYESLANATQQPVPGSQPSDPVRKKVEFNKDFGYVRVDGYTLTDPAEAWVSVKQNRPLKISLVVSQDDSGKWKTRVSSSEENVGLDISVAAVNPKMLAEKWYEKLSLAVDFGGGSSGGLLGVGVDVRLGKFRVGPMVWATMGPGSFSTYYGATFGWSPFKR